MKTIDLKNTNKQTRKAWNQNAAFWDERMGEGNDWVEYLVWPATERFIDLKPGERILDIACGNGLTSRRLAALGADVIAFDFSKEMINFARKRTIKNTDRIKYLVLDATDEKTLMTLGERKFDAANCSMALFDIADIKPLFHALTKLLKPDGRFVFSVAHPCFNTSQKAHIAEMEERDGEIYTVYAIKVYNYIDSRIEHAIAFRDQSNPQFLFHRPLQELFGTGFNAGFVLDGLEEPTFSPDLPVGKNQLSWNSNYCKIPPVLVARMRLLGK
ncbi:MAG: class I SAM-dependent methyltransferase [bacterium]|nr:MAG: class I SAM-dependent methyltransferase [bacterium]